MTVRELTGLLSAAGVPDAGYDARELFRVFGGAREYELFLPDTSSDSPELLSAADRRCRREPLAYILGECGFYRETYKVTPACLIPRQETELLVDYGVKNLPRGARFLDLCTGSGCIALSILKNRPDTAAVALDISAAALNVAMENADRLALTDRVEFVLSDLRLYEPCERFSAIFSNPPYVRADVYPDLSDEVHTEPRLALVGDDPDGAGLYRRIISKYKKNLSPGGFFALEIGYDQADALMCAARDNHMRAEILPDLSGLPRLAVLREEKIL